MLGKPIGLLQIEVVCDGSGNASGRGRKRPASKRAQHTLIEARTGRRGCGDLRGINASGRRNTCSDGDTPFRIGAVHPGPFEALLNFGSVTSNGRVHGALIHCSRCDRSRHCGLRLGWWWRLFPLDLARFAHLGSPGRLLSHHRSFAEIRAPGVADPVP